MIKAGLIQSRLDFWLISIQLEYIIKDVKIKVGNNSDHSLISLALQILDSRKRGKGLWKFNNNLLADKNYVAIIKELIKEIKSNTDIDNKNIIWDYAKCDIRSHTITYASKKSKARKKI